MVEVYMQMAPLARMNMLFIWYEH